MKKVDSVKTLETRQAEIVSPRRRRSAEMIQ